MPRLADGPGAIFKRVRIRGGVLLIAGCLVLTGCSSTPSHKAASTTTGDTTGDTGETTSTLAYDPAPPTSEATTTTLVAPPTTTPTTAPGTVLTISGSSPATQVTIDVDGQETQHTGIPLPWTQTLTEDPGIVVLLSQTGSGDQSATVTCSIAPPGQSPVTNTSTGAYATVTCEDNTHLP